MKRNFFADLSSDSYRRCLHSDNSEFLRSKLMAFTILRISHGGRAGIILALDRSGYTAGRGGESQVGSGSLLPHRYLLPGPGVRGGGEERHAALLLVVAPMELHPVQLAVLGIISVKMVGIYRFPVLTSVVTLARCRFHSKSQNCPVGLMNLHHS